MQGRLIQAFLARVRRLDPEHTDYDADLREVRRAADPALPAGATGRAEYIADDVPCQVSPADMDALRLVAGGNDPTQEAVLTLHYKHLRRMGLVDTDGRSKIGVGARIEALLSIRSRAAILSFPDPPGLYVTKAEPRGWGIDMSAPTLNLVDLHVGSRQRMEAGA